MKKPNNQFNPDYAVPPGWVLKEHIEALDISQQEFASRCGYSLGVISEIIAGKGRIEPQLAATLGRETRLNESIWLGIEADYRRMLDELSRNAELSEWAKKFPVKELVNRGAISKHSLEADNLARMLSFFDVWSIGAFQDKYGAVSTTYRHSSGLQSSLQALATWLRLGEIEAEQTECADYNKETFTQSLMQIRTLTATNTNQVFTEAKNLCRQSGVALCFTKPFPGIALSGAAWWTTTSQNPIIQLSARHMTDDHLWFSLFHEAAHILLHSNKQVFIDPIRSQSANSEHEESETESDADQWAQNFLIPRPQWDEFANSFRGNPMEVQQFAQQQGIAPGIIVGRLQRQGLLPWDRLNNLKRKLEWTAPPAHEAQD